jgi:hypothetical protein
VLSKLARTWEPPFTAGANLQVQPNTILTLGSTPNPEDVLVQSSTPGPLGTFSVRTSTIQNHVVAEALTAVSSFRAYCAKTHGHFLTSQAGYFRSTIGAGLGYIDNIGLIVDLSVIGARPTQPTDEIHLSVRLDVPENLTEGRIIFDVDSSTHDFSQNYYYASFRASDLTPAVASTSTTQTAIQTSITQAQIDQYNAMNPGGFGQQALNSEFPSQFSLESTYLAAASSQAGTGTSQWTELFIPLSSLIRVGTDTSRTLANVQGVRIYFNVAKQTVCDVHGLYIKGSYGPDVGTVGNDYYYRYRRRSSTTGAKSNPSPYIRSGIRPHNQRIAITMQGDDTEGDQLDVFRWGGAVTAASSTGTVPWLYVGSAPNPGLGTPIPNDVVFNDDFADSDILNAEVLDFDNQQPYSTIDVPRMGTCIVVGTSAIWQSGDLFNPRWGPGSIIEINGVPYTLYAQPRTNIFAEIVESATTLGASSIVSYTSRPTAFDNPDPILGGIAFDNPTFAYDNNAGTAATVGNPPMPPRPPGTVTQTARQNPWNYLDNIKVNDNNFATVGLSADNPGVNKSYLINATNFGFNIPLTETILGIVVTITHIQYNGTAAVYDDIVELLNLGTVINHNSFVPWGLGPPKTYTYGSPTDTWGGIPPTPARINDPAFGVQIGIECTLGPHAAAVAGIQYVSITVYTASSGGVLPGQDASCRWLVLSNPPSAPVFLTANLNVLAYSADLSIQNNSTAYIEYSLNGGITWHVLWNDNNHYALAPDGSYAPVLDTVTLSVTQDLTKLQVRVFASCPGGDSGAEFISVNEIYVTVTYYPAVLNAVPFILRQPTLLAQPMYAQWGPFLGYLQAVGDPYQPGVLHATKPNQPDEGSDLLDVEITPPSEPLLNGCMFGNGASFVWSTQRMFQLASSSDLGLQFTPTGGGSTGVPFVPQEVPGAPGLFAPWAFCVGDKIYYLSVSGIVATTGGTPVSITDPDLSLLFPKDGRPGEPVKLGAATFQPPDFAQTQALRLYYEKNHVKFAYIDINGKRQIIVYSVILGVWTTDDYVTTSDPQIVSCYSEEGQSINRNLLGGNNFVYQEQGDLETGNIEGFQVRMAQASDFPMGFLMGRDGYLGLMTVTPSLLDIMVDSGVYTHLVPSTAGAYDKVYVPLQAIKGRFWEWSFTSVGAARLFLRDCWFGLKPWNGQKFEPFQPFRNLDRELTK